jgi:hypothetical protein
LSDEKSSDVLTSYSKHFETRRIHTKESKEDGEIRTKFRTVVKQGKILAKSLRDGADLTSSVVAFLAIDECVTNMEQILKHE